MNNWHRLNRPIQAEPAAIVLRIVDIFTSTLFFIVMRKLAFISTRTIKQKRAVTKNSIDEFQLPVCAPAKEQHQNNMIISESQVLVGLSLTRSHIITKLFSLL